MKLNSPFLVLFILSLFLICCTSNGTVATTDEEAAINTYLEQVTTDTVPADKLKHVEKAIQLAKQTNNTFLHYQSVIYKLDYCIAPNYPDSIPFYFNHLLDLASKTKNAAESKAYVFAKKGDYAFFSGEYQKAYGFYYESKKIYENEKDNLRMGYNLLRISQIQLIYNDYRGSEETITEALQSFQLSEEPHKDYIREAYNKLGMSYTGLKDYKEAIKCYNKAKEYTVDHELSIKMIDNNIALCYLEEAKYQEAVQMFTALYASNSVKKDTVTFVSVTDNLGFSKFKADGISGKDLMEQALAIRLRRTDEKGVVYSYLNLSQYHKTKNPPLARNYAQKAYTLATKIGAIDHRLEALKLLSIIGGKSYNQEFFRLNDSVNNFRQKAKNQFAKIRFDATKEKNENVALKLKQAEERTRNLIVGIISGSFIILLIFLYFRDKRKHKNEKRKQKREEEYRTETRIAKKLHDELANDVFNTMTFAEVRDLATPENKETLLDNLDKIYEQTRNISKENSNIDTGEKYLSHLKETLSGYGSQEVNIILKGIDSIDWQNIESAKKIVVYRVLQELLVNMKKHSKATLVVFTFKKINKKIQINYSDNGVGTGTDEYLRKNGLQNVENRIQNINGRITFEPTPEKGFKVHFTFNA